MYLERVKNLDLEELDCRQEMVEILEIKSLFHNDLNSHYCVDWSKAHEAHLFREKTLETADLTGTSKRSIFGPVIYRPLKEFHIGPGLIAEPPTHRTGKTRNRIAIPAQRRAVEKLPHPKSIGLLDTARTGPKLAEDPRQGEPFRTSHLD